MKPVKPLTLWLVLCCPLGIMADGARYGGQHTLTAMEGTLKVVHFHDWDSEKIPRLYGDVAHHEAFLGSKNDFASIEVTDPTDHLNYRRPSPALTTIWISPDKKFIVGLSNVMLRNPYQLVVWRGDGTLLYAEHISPQVARLTPKEFEEFCRAHPGTRDLFKGRTQQRDGAVYLDYDITGLGMAVGDDGWQLLFSHQAPNPYSDDFTGTVTNYVYWFDAAAPEIAIKESGGTILLTLKSPKGRTMRVEFPAK